ncbi:DUF4040 domain-containing protein [Streptomyces sp. NPDC051322]|uniref:Na(+)/H(+) antiporter subunit B n=1 Tax=Streptomyces sp. NPDC051322 TaxID=3154645 RepID=UPI00344F883B
MTVLIAVALTVVGLLGTAVVLTAAPERQAVSLSVFGLALTVLFVVLLAPDVALSQLGIGAAMVPLMVMLASRRIRRDQDRERHRAEGENG